MRTEGLLAFGHLEVKVEIHEGGIEEEGREFLSYISNYVIKSGARLQAGETMSYGYWATKFMAAEDGMLETWEYNAEATRFIKGATLTLRYWKNQNSICKKYHADFDPPNADKLSVISKGVLEGLPVQGVRYPSPDHMSGWWITTEQYDGNIDSLTNEHTYHITAARPELAKYLALPPGFRFDLSSFEDVWFEEEVANA
jgi:hypothetical protein